MRVSLRSDYHDCYDVWLEDPGCGDVDFSRMAGDSWSVPREAMFGLFGRLGIATPRFQKAADFSPDEQIVLYEDAYAHCGEGKRLVTAAEAVAAGQGQVSASEFVGDFPGLSYRLFVVGGVGAWFEHWSLEDWRSNCGDGDLGLVTEGRGHVLGLKEIEAACRGLRNPLWAIDFVGRRTEAGIELLAIDWNPAPRLAGTPAAEALRARHGGNEGIAKAVREAVLREAARKNVRTVDNNRILLDG
jgi:hypothetical protein